MSFTDGNADLNDESPENADAARYAAGRPYSVEETSLGRVWISAEGLLMDPPVMIRYEKHPWIEKFEFDGIRPAPARRKGIGTKDARGFVRSLSTIYAPAYDEYREYGGGESFDAAEYFRHAARHFARMAEDEGKAKLYAKFCGFAENMWREGDREMLDVCMRHVLPALADNEKAAVIFTDTVTQEFLDYLEGEEVWHLTGTREKLNSN